MTTKKKKTHTSSSATMLSWMRMRQTNTRHETKRNEKKTPIAKVPFGKEEKKLISPNNTVFFFFNILFSTDSLTLLLRKTYIQYIYLHASVFDVSSCYHCMHVMHECLFEFIFFCADDVWVWRYDAIIWAHMSRPVVSSGTIMLRRRHNINPYSRSDTNLWVWMRKMSIGICAICSTHRRTVEWNVDVSGCDAEGVCDMHVELCMQWNKLEPFTNRAPVWNVSLNGFLFFRSFL